MGSLYDNVGNTTIEETRQNIDKTGLRGTSILEDMHDVKASIDRRGGATVDLDDRSSSLSEIDDGTAAEGLENGTARPILDADGSDTEAETERLEESPQKLRAYKNVLLTASGDAHPLDVNVNGVEVIASAIQTPS